MIVLMNHNLKIVFQSISRNILDSFTEALWVRLLYDLLTKRKLTVLLNVHFEWLWRPDLKTVKTEYLVGYGKGGRAEWALRGVSRSFVPGLLFQNSIGTFRCSGSICSFLLLYLLQAGNQEDHRPSYALWLSQAFILTMEHIKASSFDTKHCEQF